METLRLRIAILLFILKCIDAGVAAECPDGYSPHGDNCYLLVQQQQTWFESQIACWSMGSRLVEIESPEEDNFVAGLIHSRNVDFAWTGMTDFAEEGVFMLTSQHSRLEYSNWQAGEPNDAATGEDCIFMDGNGKWWDAECHNYRKPFVCEIPNGELTGPGDLIG